MLRLGTFCCIKGGAEFQIRLGLTGGEQAVLRNDSAKICDQDMRSLVPIVIYMSAGYDILV